MPSKDNASHETSHCESTETVPSRQSPPPENIGPYRILERIGEGGMGVVYLAEQTKPIRRRVALKVIKPGMDSRAVIARFEAERQALALMDHPGVAKVFDAGTTERGRPFFAMEHVAGVPITEHCDRHKLGIEERLKLFMNVCDAVQHAHQKGIIHRDIKPSNILVAFKDDHSRPPLGKPEQRGIPVAKVIDFGVAKAMDHRLTEKTIFTEQGQIIGTPSYMSPEQAEMTAQDVDTRSDIYSLGVLLYELLTGELPFDPKSLLGAAFDEIRRMIREVEPPKPSTRLSALQSEPRPPEPRASARADIPHRKTAKARQSRITAARGSALEVARVRRSDPRTLIKCIRGDLDWVTMKALEKDRTRRYASATDFAADIRRHLNHEPVVASPPSSTYRVKKFVRRNRGIVAAVGVIALVLLAATGVSIGFALSEAEQRRIAMTAEQDQRRARKEAEQTRDNLKTVTEFQQSMLGDIDAEKMGRGIIDELREGIRKGLGKKEGMAPQEIATSLASFDRLIGEVNATNLALNVVDENVLSRAVETIHKEFADQPLVRAALEQTVADTYRDIGLYERAIPLQQAVLDTRRDELGDDQPRTLTSINNMGFLLRSTGKYEKALLYYREALESRRRVLGDDHPDTLISINNMGFLLQAMGKYEEASPFYREALVGKRRVLGNDHPDTLESIHNIGFVLEAMGKYEEALPYYREALEGYRRVLGDNHSDTLGAINSMGSLLESMGKYEEALPYSREAMQGYRRVLGDDHPHTLTSINNMGLLLMSMGKYKKALPYSRDALEGYRLVLGDDHPYTLTSINNMGLLLESMGKNEQALPYWREALEISRRVLGDDHPQTLISIHNMGGLMRDLGRLEEAEVLGTEAVQRARQALPEGHLHMSVFLDGYAQTVEALRRYADAEVAELEAYEIMKTALGAKHKRTIGTVKSLIDLYDTWDAAEPGKGYAEKAAAWRAKLPQENDG